MKSITKKILFLTFLTLTHLETKAANAQQEFHDEVNKILTQIGSYDSIAWGSADTGCYKVKVLLEAMKRQGKIKKVDITINFANNEATKAIAQYLESDKQLEVLELFQNKIDDEGIEALGKALKVNSSLIFLRLRVVQAQDGFKSFTQHLASNLSLQRIYFETADTKSESALNSCIFRMNNRLYINNHSTMEIIYCLTSDLLVLPMDIVQIILDKYYGQPYKEKTIQTAPQG